MDTNLNIWEYFEKREEEIVRKRALLKEELDEVRQARAALENRRKYEASRDNKEKLTIKEMIKSVLIPHPDGGTSDQIINWINEKHGSEVARTSLSPQLSRLKADGSVSLDEATGLWSLTAPLRHADRTRHRSIFEGHEKPHQLGHPPTRRIEID